ncbi:hypothetical protein PIB30_098195 [Stylosanthes scabra]|uniref:Uncharacterized protein n=1 Tax=Stylosanthes scabra TaxID=79078 RepID=A0ABU6ZVA2_9FABA|nr:hypothetical protein [Stylosanthes scabra]
MVIIDQDSTRSGSHDDFQSCIPNMKTNCYVTRSPSYYPKANRPHSPPISPSRRSASRSPHPKAPGAFRPGLRLRPIEKIDLSFPWVPEPKAFPPLLRIPTTF